MGKNEEIDLIFLKCKVCNILEKKGNHKTNFDLNLKICKICKKNNKESRIQQYCPFCIRFYSYGYNGHNKKHDKNFTLVKYNPSLFKYY
jgi:hypothetical protein